MSYLGTVVQAKSLFFEVLIQKRKSAGLGPCGVRDGRWNEDVFKKGKMVLFTLLLGVPKLPLL